MSFDAGYGESLLVPIPHADIICRTAMQMSDQPDKLFQMLKGVVARSSSIFRVSSWDPAYKAGVLARMADRLGDGVWVERTIATILPSIQSSWDHRRAYRVLITLVVFDSMVGVPVEETVPGDDFAGPEIDEDILMHVLNKLEKRKNIKSVRNEIEAMRKRYLPCEVLPEDIPDDDFVDDPEEELEEDLEDAGGLASPE